MEEKISVSCNRDGGLESMEVSGMLTLRISDGELARIRLALHNPSKTPPLPYSLYRASYDMIRTPLGIDSCHVSY